MGILRTREEYLPVTCAILKPQDRETFFESIHMQKESRPEHIARLCETSAEVVNDWISGKANVPYHSLQTLAHHYQVALPPVGELRREYLAVSQTPSRHEPPASPKRVKAEPAHPKAPPARHPKAKAAKPRREREPKAARPARRAEPKGKAPPAASPARPKAPEPSEKLAYWVGATLLTSRREAGEIVMTANRAIGQNFAGTWANLSRELFGVRPSLKMLEGGKAQEARLPVSDIAESLDHLDLREGKPFADAGVPRWAWSNPAWKAACLKGIVDARAHFQRAPALVLDGLPERLVRALQKLVAAFGLEASVSSGSMELKGKEAIEAYFSKIGTANMKLRDQYRAFVHPRGARGARRAMEEGPSAPEQPVEAAAVEEEPSPQERERVLAEEVEAADEEVEASEEALQEALGSEPGADESLDAAIDAAAAAKAAASDQPSRFGPPPPQPKKPPRHGRRTLYRGRPRR